MQKENFNRRIGQRIKKFRGERGILMNELADFLKISIGHMSDTERGKNSITIWNLYNMCNLFDCSILDFLRGYDD